MKRKKRSLLKKMALLTFLLLVACVGYILIVNGVIPYFSKAKLYSHKRFKDIDSSYYEAIKDKLLESCRTDEGYEYMKGYEPWEALIQDN